MTLQDSAIQESLEAVETPIRAFLELHLFSVSGTEVTPSNVILFLIIMAFAWGVSRVVQRVINRTALRSGVADEGTTSTIKRLTHYGILMVGFGVGLESMGISLSAVFAAGAVFAVGVGFALQNILQNFVSGVILLAERSITQKDVLEVEGQMILIEKIGARATVARTREDEQLIIPNTTLVQSTVTNYTLSDDHFRVRARVGVAYSSDMKVVEETLDKAARTVKDRIPARDPVVLLLDFGDSSVLWEVSIWAEDPWAARLTRSDLNKAIWWGLKDAGVTIAFPQLDVHFDPEVLGRVTEA